MIQLTASEYELLSSSQRRLDALRAMCGYVEDGSDTTVRIGQDDATKEWFLSIAIGPYKDKRFYASSFYGVIDLALADHHKNPDR